MLVSFWATDTSPAKRASLELVFICPAGVVFCWLISISLLLSEMFFLLMAFVVAVSVLVVNVSVLVVAVTVIVSFFIYGLPFFGNCSSMVLCFCATYISFSKAASLELVFICTADITISTAGSAGVVMSWVISILFLETGVLIVISELL